jgi:hypothetical protein
MEGHLSAHLCLRGREYGSVKINRKDQVHCAVASPGTLLLLLLASQLVLALLLLLALVLLHRHPWFRQLAGGQRCFKVSIAGRSLC